MIRFGKPISVLPFYDLRKEKGDNVAALALRDSIFASLTRLVVHIPCKEDVELFETIFLLSRKETIKKMKLKKGIESDFQADRSILEGLNKKFLAEPQSKEGLKKQLDAIKEKSHTFKIPSTAIFQNEETFPSTLILVLLSLFMFPFSVPGTLINGWLFGLVHYRIRKNVKDPQFWSSYSFVVTLLFFSLWYFALVIIGTILLKNIFVSLFLVIFAHLSGIMGWELLQLWKSHIWRAKIESIKRQQPLWFAELQNFMERIAQLLQ